MDQDEQGLQAEWAHVLVLSDVETHVRPTHSIPVQVRPNRCTMDQGRDPRLLSILKEGSSGVIRQYRIGGDCQLIKLG